MKKKPFNCPAEMTISLIDGKWKTLLLFMLRKEPKRFGELRRLAFGITQSTLTKELRELENCGLINREKIGKELYNGVEYSLTEKGQSMRSIINLLIKWGLENQDDYVLDDYKVHMNKKKI